MRRLNHTARNALGYDPDAVLAVYGLRDPRTGKVCYVGQTRDLEMRYAQHVRGELYNKEKNEWLLELRALGLKPELVVFHKPPSSGPLKKLELAEICKWKLRGEADLNIKGSKAMLNLSKTSDLAE